MKGKFQVIDCNRHVIEPADIWDGWLEDPFKGQGLVQVGEGHSVTVRGRPVTQPRPGFLELPEYRGIYSEASAAGFNAESHLKDMDVEGVDVAVLLPTSGMYVVWADHVDSALATALCRAYNNWLHDYCKQDVSRLKPVALVPLQSIDEAIIELRRAVQELGCVAAYMRPNPLVTRKLHNPAYDRLYKEAENLGVPILLHEAGGSVLHQMGHDRFETMFEREAVLDPYEMMLALMSFLGHDVLERFPSLNVGYMGAGSGWLPYWLERVDEHWGGPFGPESPSNEAPSLLFKRQGFVTVEPGERTTPEVVEEVGDHCIVWGSQYPHPELSQFPDELDSFVDEPLLSDEVKRKILWDNAARIFRIS